FRENLERPIFLAHAAGDIARRTARGRHRRTRTDSAQSEVARHAHALANEPRASSGFTAAMNAHARSAHARRPSRAKPCTTRAPVGGRRSATLGWSRRAKLGWRRSETFGWSQ